MVGYGFKPIDSFSFDECLNTISRIKSEGKAPDQELLDRYYLLLSELQNDDDSHFKRCVAESDFRAYVNSFPKSKDTSLYQPLHIREAKDSIARIEAINRKERRQIFLVVITAIVVIIGIICWCNYAPVNYINVPETITFSKYGETTSLQVVSNVSDSDIDIELVNGSGWLQCSGSLGSYKLSASPNSKGPRSMMVKVSAPNRFFGSIISWDSKAISIEQESGEPSYIRLDRSSMSFDKYGKPIDKSFCTIATDGVLENVASAPEWCKASFELIDNNHFKCTVVLDVNNDGKKNGNIEFKGGNITATLAVSQESGLASHISFEKSSISVPASDYWEYALINTDGTSWSVSSSPSWISASIENGNSLKLCIEENDGNKRSGYVSVQSNNGQSATLTVNQASALATYIRVGQSTLNVSTSGLDKYIPVSTDGKSWSIYSSPSWLTATQNSDKTKVYVQVPSNSGKLKDGEIILASNNGHRATIKVKQDGEPTDFGVSQSTVYFSKESDYDYISIRNNSKLSVSVSSDKGWLDYYLNGKQLKISVPSNKTSGRRSGVITLRCGSQTVRVTVKQNGYFPCVNPYCQGGRVWNDFFGWGPCMVCGTHGGKESKW